MNIAVIHSYGQLVLWGVAAPLLCGVCQSTLRATPDFDETGVMHCYGCDNDVILGQESWQRMKNAVANYEFYREYME